MKWNFDDDRAIYTQIVEQMKTFIISGKLEPGARLSSVRELASSAGVNPNTMQRALSELEQMGLVFSNRTSGRFVTDDENKISELKNAVAEEKVRKFILHMDIIGMQKEDIIKLIKDSLAETEL
ncbi:MAG: GntR family transcriptional regulator [Bacillota bacterium]|nr:GntR family transcriptional regulator [Bacillota bacterium]